MNKVYRRMRATRIAVAAIVAIVAAGASALGYDSLFNRWQALPALMACCFIWLLAWAALTLVLGRLYCSTVCPMGTLQDAFMRIFHRRDTFHYRQPSNALRRSIVVIVFIAAMLGFPVVTVLIDPAAAFSRVFSMPAAPLLSAAAFSIAGCCIALGTLLTAAIVAARCGRRLCNTMCPVGTLMGGIANFAIYRIDINTDKCVGCGHCTAVCRSECIDPSAHTVDTSRCVVCLDCTAECPTGAITLRRGRHRLQMPLMQPIITPPETAAMDAPSPLKRLDRRSFLTAVTGLGALKMLAADTNDTAALNAVVPPGSVERSAFLSRCTGCGICVNSCPSGIIKPSVRELGVRAMLHPVLDFNRGWCLYDCVKCTTVCPAGALEKLSPAAKHKQPIGKARIVATHCIEYTTGKACGICARRCPVQAIKLLPVDEHHSTGKNVRRLPEVDFDRCIGCGACHYYCPSTPRAWIIEGL